MPNPQRSVRIGLVPWKRIYPKVGPCTKNLSGTLRVTYLGSCPERDASLKYPRSWRCMYIPTSWACMYGLAYWTDTIPTIPDPLRIDAAFTGGIDLYESPHVRYISPQDPASRPALLPPTSLPGVVSCYDNGCSKYAEVIFWSPKSPSVLHLRGIASIHANDRVSPISYMVVPYGSIITMREREVLLCAFYVWIP